MAITMFYAWQSDTNEKLNHYFIRDAAKAALKNVQQDLEIVEADRLDYGKDLGEIAIELDHDTKDVSGMIEIMKTIMEKIDACSIFLADLTFVGRTESNPVRPEAEAKFLPNPNVAFELGYAIHSLGPERIIPIMNKHYGPPEKQIFDLAHRRRPIIFDLPPNASKEDQKKEFEKLSKAIQDQVKLMLKRGLLQEFPQDPDPVEDMKKLLSEKNYIQIEELVRKHLGRLEEGISSEAFPLENVPLDEQELQRRMTAYEAHTANLRDLMVAGCYYDGQNTQKLWLSCLETVAKHHEKGEHYYGANTWNDLRLYPSLILLYAGGITALAKDNYALLAVLFVRARVASIQMSDEFVWAVNPWTVIEDDKLRKWISLQKEDYPPLSQHLCELLSAPLEPYFFNDDARYQECFDRFEYLLGLVVADLSPRHWGTDSLKAPVGLFARRWVIKESSVLSAVEGEILKETGPFELLNHGLFSGQLPRFWDVKRGYDAYVASWRDQYARSRPSWR